MYFWDMQIWHFSFIIAPLSLFLSQWQLRHHLCACSKNSILLFPEKHPDFLKMCCSNSPGFLVPIHIENLCPDSRLKSPISDFYLFIFFAPIWQRSDFIFLGCVNKCLFVFTRFEPLASVVLDLIHIWSLMATRPLWECSDRNSCIIIFLKFHSLYRCISVIIIIQCQHLTSYSKHKARQGRASLFIQRQRQAIKSALQKHKKGINIIDYRINVFVHLVSAIIL